MLLEEHSFILKYIVDKWKNNKGKLVKLRINDDDYKELKQLLEQEKMKLDDNFLKTAIFYLEDEGLIKRPSHITTKEKYVPTQEGIKLIDSRKKKENMPKDKTRKVPEKGFKKNKSTLPHTFWNLLHPKITAFSKSRFDSKHYADSAEAALKEVNNIVKAIVKEKTGNEYDGADLMNRAFSIDRPIIKLEDLSTETGKNIQKGYMQIFAGAMTGIRNPKAHANIIIDSNRAIHFLFLASLLMYVIDEKHS